MKANVSTKTKKAKVEVVNDLPKKEDVELLSLEEIIKKMTAIALEDTDDYLKLMANEKKMNQWEKLANAEMHRLQFKALMQDTEPVDVKPLEVKFISSKTNEQLERVQRIENQVKDGRTIKQDA